MKKQTQGSHSGATVLAFAMVGALALLVIENLPTLSTSPSPARAQEPFRTSQPQVPSGSPPTAPLPSPASTNPSVPPTTPADTGVPTALAAPEALWSVPAREPQFAAFQRWTARYLNADATTKPALESEGVQLATARREALHEVISNDPERAIALAVPYGVARELPEAVRSLMETRVNGRGSIDVFGAMARQGSALQGRPVFRKATIGDQTFDAFVYGQRLAHRTRSDVRINGVALDNQLAVSESPLRVLDTTETAERLPAASDSVCSVSGNPAAENGTPLAAASGDETFVLCGPSHVLRLSAQLSEAEDLAANGSSGSLAASTETEGTKKLILIRVDFSDLPGEPFTGTAGTNLVNGLDSFYGEMSYGRSRFHPCGSGSAVTPTLRMPQTTTYYTAVNQNRFLNLRNDARAAAIAAGYSLGNFDYDIICYSDLAGFYWSGLGYVGAPGSWLNGSFSVGVAGHELGHNYSLDHASFWDTSGTSVLGGGTNTTRSIEYGDNQDTMGSANAGSYHFNVRNKHLLNWIRTNEVLTATNSGTYRIFPHDDATVTGARALKVARGASSNYWVEFRQKFTSNKWLMSGAGIRMAPVWNDYTQLLDMTPGSTDGKNDAPLVVGRTFSDFTSGVHITTLRKGGTTPESLDIVVNLGSFIGNQEPTLALNAPTLTAGTGVTLTFTAVATDPDGDPLAYHWDFGDSALGTNGAVAGKSWSSAGEYVVRCVASDMKGRTASDSVVVTIGTPSTYSVRGTITADGNPVQSVRVTAGPFHSAYTDSDGTYIITGVSPGTYQMGASHPDFDSFTASGFANPVTVGPSRTGIDFTGEGGETGGGSVALTAPTSSATYTAPATVVMQAAATATPGQGVQRVDFYRGSTKLGEDSIPPYSYTWTAAPAGSYALTARSYDSGGFTATSAPVNITVNPVSPTITSQPQSKSVDAGDNVTFSVSVSGSAPFTYRWRRNGTNLPGAVSSSLALNNVQPNQAGGYSVVVTNAAGTVTSSTANLTVICNYTLSTNQAAFGSSGGSGSVSVTTAGSCDWDVTDVPSWITINSGETGTGNGMVNFSVAPNTNASSRIVTLHIDAANFVISQGAPDLTRPTVAFSSPSSSATLTSAVVTVTGTARDNDNVARVDIALGEADFEEATGTEDWTSSVTLQPGTNIVRVRSVDLSGNISLTNTRALFCAVPSSLSLVVTGSGAVSGATNGQAFPIGKACKLTAVPQAGYVFSNWSGQISSQSPSLTFLMRSNLHLEANFVTNPFSASKGVFNGLFHEDDQVRLGHSGSFTFTLADKGTYSGWVQIGTRKTKASGRLNLEGRATNVVNRPGTNALTITWAVALDGSDQITGTISDGTWMATLLGDRATFSKVNPADFAGPHTFLILGTPGGGLAPEGDSFGTVSVDASGVVKLKGTLADKTPVNARAPLSKHGQWPLYIPLYAGKGALLGWVNFTNQPTTDLEGLLSWIKPAIPGTALFPDGFDSDSALIGSRYRPPSGETNRLLSLSNAVVTVSGGNLPAAYTNDVLIGASGKLTNAGPDRIVWSFVPSSGLFNGSFTPAGGTKAVPFHGAALQKAGIAGGFFLGTNRSGRIALEPPPVSAAQP